MNAPGWLLATATALLASAAHALPPSLDGTETTDIRLFLGTWDGSENPTLLRRDGHHFTLGLGASSPVAWDKRVEANLEVWLTERGYPAAQTAGGVATDTLTLRTAALTYGVRVRANVEGAWRPYGVLALGVQGNRLEGDLITTPASRVKEETLTASGAIGAGIEWRVGHDLFSVDWRHWSSQGDFTRFGARELELGGDFLGIGLGHRW